ncbi:hypothetical protein D0T49_08795 [Paludibacter sp. 221]|uniref:hypothetical protein n=1 Tax=Paludibacter sp. 221 TaxID=2302939 RepID=UPI0013D14847|nr:hypothetical protein [Paludibacter sp. 221]NDV47140.1 hypothetical protein [Paludibacter sp. 221]
MNRKQFLLQAFILACLFQFSFFNFSAKAQVTIGADSQPNENAVLDLHSNYATGKYGGLLMPRVALTSTASASPLATHVAGMTVYNTKTTTGDMAVYPGLYFNDGTKWIRQQEAIEEDERTIVYVNKNDPNLSGTRFDDVPLLDDEGNANPDFVNDNSLKANVNYIYVASDNTMWIYDSGSSKYISYKSPAATAWYKSGSSLDAGADKEGRISRNGFIGIGRTASKNIAIAALNENLDHSGGYVYATYSKSLIVSNGTQPSYQRGVVSVAHQRVPTGVTNSGNLIGLLSQTYKNGTDNGGTLNAMRGVYVAYGHSDVDDAGTTNTAAGLYITPYIQSGEITTSYDIYLGAYNGTGTIANKYGIYIAGSDKANYIQGTLGLGVTAPTARLDIRGYLRLAGTDPLGTDNPEVGMLRHIVASGLQVYRDGAWRRIHDDSYNTGAVKVGTPAITEKGALRLTDEGDFQIYNGSAWQTIMTIDTP